MTAYERRRLLLLQLDEGAEGYRHYLRESERDETVFFIDLSQGPVDERPHPEGLDVVDLDPYFQISVSELRREYIEFVDGIPDIRGGGNTVNDDLSYGNISAWWTIVDQFKSKTADYDHPFNQICRVDAVRRLVKERGVDCVALLGGNSQERYIYSEAVKNEAELITSPGRDPSLIRSAASALIRGYLRIILEFFKYLSARVTDLTHPPTENDSEKTAVFFTRSLNWAQYGWKKDRYFYDLPDRLDSETDWGSTYLMHLSNKPFAAGLRASVREIGNIGEQRKTGAGLLLTQSYISMGAFLSASLKHAKDCVTTVRLTGSEEFREACTIAGIDIYPLVLKGTWAGMENVPQMELLFRSVYRFFGSRSDDCLTTPFFESKKGRTVVAAARSTGQEQSIGLQHGPITDGKLQYYYSHPLEEDSSRGDSVLRYPLPDTIVVDGESAKKLLKAGGFPESRIVVTGGIRYDQLFEVVQNEKISENTGGRGEDGKHTCTVFFGLSDFEHMASIVVPDLKEHGGYRANLKPHPSVRRETIDTIERIAEETGYEDYDIVETDAHELIVQSDLVISSYSSTAVETLAFEKPLIYVGQRNSIDVSPFTDAEFISKVARVSELVKALDTVDETEYKDDLERFLDEFFYKRDGKSSERLLDLYSSVLQEDDK